MMTSFEIRILMICDSSPVSKTKWAGHDHLRFENRAGMAA
ncbi:hypothetical protein D3OALGB2SA_208 [Olavius algarvensis associated proteobacterium Delta 3]|nr:hypothetical protein D3OALGB2SA_208 [Olavius algarvensis associated proteobacterium Delta 3]